MSTANVNVSTATKQLIAAALVTGFAKGVIELYSGAKPADSDSAVSGTLLAKVTIAGVLPYSNSTSASNGLSFTSAAGVISKATEDWKAKGVAIGTIGWGRLRTSSDSDTGQSSTAYARIDFDVGVTSGVLQLTSLATTVGSVTTIDTFSLAQATQ